jgi:diguanylate cyclase (GGDEF)-like protein
LTTLWLAVPLAVALLLSLAVIARTLRLPEFPGKRSFLLLLVAVSWWIGMVAVEHASPQPEVKVFFAELAWPGIVVTPTGWALFIWNYLNGRYRPVPRGFFVASAFLAAGTLLLALTNGAHHLLYTRTVPVGTAPFMATKYYHGAFYYGITTAMYLVMLLTEMFIFLAIVRATGVYRKHYLGLAAASLIPWIANALYLAQPLDGIAIDPTPFSFIAMNVVLYWLISRRQFFDLMPIAHSALLDAIPDPVIVLDGAMRIAECNPAALRLAGDGPLVGRTLASVPALGESLGWVRDPEGRTEAVIGDPARYYDVGREALTFAGREVGLLVLLRDISNRKAAEQQLREESVRDALTRLHNRRFLAEIGPGLLADAARSGAPLAALMLDIDHFKRFNDTYGHQAGDAVLRATGAFLHDGVRQSDAVFRMGGEEFLVLLPRTQKDQAHARAEALRTAFMSEAFAHDGVALSATFSVGLAMYPAEAASLEELLHRADAALYRAKLDGRNRVRCWQDGDGAA